MGRSRQELEILVREQRHLLAKSVDDFYSGDLVEAIRIATAIRVLIYESARSKPLLKQLNNNYLQLQILDHKPDPLQKHIVAHFPIGFRISGERVLPVRDLSGPQYELCILGRWWERQCLIIPLGEEIARFSRKELVLAIANKDGGAHVDSDLPAKYRALIENSPVSLVVNGREMDTVNLARWMVGQSGAELLDYLNRNFTLCGDSNRAEQDKS